MTTVRTARRALACAVVALAVALAPHGPSIAAQPTPDAFPERVGTVADATGAVDARALGRRFAAALGEPYRLEGLILVRDDCGDDVDRLLDRALVHYGLSPRLGEMADDAVAFLVCPTAGVARFAYAVHNPYSAWLDPHVVEGAMSSALAEGDPDADAVVLAGIAAAERALVAAPRPTPLASAPPAPEPPAEQGVPNSTIALLLVAALAGALGAWRYRMARRPPAATGDWLPRLQEIAERAGAYAPEIAGDAPRLARLVQRCEPLGEPVRVALYRRHESMARRLNELERGLAGETGPLAARGAADDEAADVRTRRERLFVSFEALRTYVERLERESAHAEELAGHAPDVIEAATAAVAAAEDRYAAASTLLDDDPRLALPPPDIAMGLPRAWLQRADKRLADGRHLQAGRDAEDAADLARRIARAAEGIGAADARIARAATALRGAGATSMAALACVRGNGAEAEAALERTAAALGATLRAAEADLGADPAAGLAANLSAAEASLERVAALCQALDARLVLLAHAASAAPDAVAAAAAALRRVVERRPPETAATTVIGGSRPLGSASERGASSDRSAAPEEAASDRAEDRLLAAEQALAAEPPEPAMALRRVLEAERWLVEAEAAWRGRRIEGRRRRHLAEIVLAELDQDIGLWLAFHRDDAGAVAVRRAEDALAALDAARTAVAGATGDAHQRLRMMLGATSAAVAVVEEATARMAADHGRADRGRAALRTPAPPEGPLPVASRRGPFPGRFGDWPTVSQVAPMIRATRWGAPPRDEGGAQSWGAGIEGW